MDKNLTSIEVIGIAVRSEEDASKFYGHIAKMITNPMVREKYENLAKEEVTHGRMLTDLYKQMLQTEEKPPKIPGTPETAEGAAIPKDIEGSLEELLKLAIEREKKAKEFYEEASRIAKDPSGKRMLQYLSNVEYGHEMMLTKELEAYQRDKGWYTDGDPSDLTHVGP